MKKTIIALAAAMVATGAMAQAIDLAKADREIADAEIANASRAAGQMRKVSDGEILQDNAGLTYQIISTEHKVCAVTGYDKTLEQTSVEVPSAIGVDGEYFTVVEIGPFAFNQAGLLQEILLPRTLVYIDDWAFGNCQRLKSIEIPESVERIGQYAFYFDVDLVEINIPAKMTEISAYTFTNCTQLSSVALPESITKIGECAFHHCTLLNSINIGKNVKEIVYNPFGDCWSLEKITVDPENPVYCDIDGVVFSKDKKTLVAYSDGHGAKYAVPEGTKVIGPYAFYYSEYLEEVTLPNTVEEIGMAAFMYSNEMTTFTVPASVKSIGQGAFFKTTNINTFVVEEGNNYYKAYSGVLYNKAGTVLVAYPGGRTGEYKALASTYAVADYGFAGAKVEKVVLPLACELIGPAAFARSGITAVDMPGVTDIYDQAFYFCFDYKECVIPASIKTLGDGVYKDCTRIEHITSYAVKAPKCGKAVFDDSFRGIPMGVLVGSLNSYLNNTTFSRMKLSEEFYRVTSQCNAAKGSVDINGQGPTAYLETWQDAEVTITPIGDNKVEKVLVNDVDFTNKLEGNYLYLSTAGVNLDVKVYFEGESGIESVNADVIETEYYNLGGAKVANPASGLYIKAEKTPAGTRYGKVVL